MIPKKKILYIHGGGNAIGGLETYLKNCLLNHARFKPYIGIVKKGEVYDYIKNSGFKDVVDLRGGKLRQLHKTLYAILNGIVLVRKKNIDFIIAHGTHAWIFAWIISKLSGVKSIFYIQGVVKEGDFSRLLVGIGLRMKPDLYIANSEYSLSTVKKYLSGNSTYNYLASDVSKFDRINQKSARSVLIKEFGLEENSYIFTIAGRIQEWKGQHIAIDAFNRLGNPRAVLLILGDCTFEKDKAYLKKLRKLASDNPRIIFTGFRYDVENIMCGSDVILHCSTDPEPFGVVVAEGMMARKVVIATSQGGPLEIIDDRVDGLLYNYANVGELVMLMDEISRDKSLAKRISENAYNKSRDLFDISVSVNKLENIISNLHV